MFGEINITDENCEFEYMFVKNEKESIIEEYIYDIFKDIKLQTITKKYIIEHGSHKDEECEITLYWDEFKHEWGYIKNVVIRNNIYKKLESLIDKIIINEE